MSVPKTFASGVFVRIPFNQSRESVLSHVHTLPTDFSDVITAYRLVQQNMKLANSSAKNELYRPLVIVGPSGAGKGTLITALQTEFP